MTMKAKGPTMIPLLLFFAEQMARVRGMLAASARRQSDGSPKKDVADPPHGTLSRYTHRGCRCLRCGTAHAAYQQRYRKREKARER